jgi:hypothetical protein
LFKVAKNPTNAKLYKGVEVAMGNGNVSSFIQTDDSGNPTEIGIIVPSAALSNLPSNPTDFAHETFELTFPTGVAIAPFDHITLDWNPAGHEPMGVYDKPHFDFHFYYQLMAEEKAIPPYSVDSSKFNILPDKGYFPAGYIRIPGGVPAMGVHWTDPTGHEYKTHDFDEAFIFGSYNGKVTFVEPMLTKAFIESKQTVSKPVPQPTLFVAGYFPKEYKVSYNSGADEYTISLTKLTKK